MLLLFFVFVRPVGFVCAFFLMPEKKKKKADEVPHRGHGAVQGAASAHGRGPARAVPTRGVVARGHEHSRGQGAGLGRRRHPRYRGGARRGPGYRTLLVTGDKDACQLASDRPRIVNTKKGITDVVIYNPAGVEEKYGVTPQQIPDYLGLDGRQRRQHPRRAGRRPRSRVQVPAEVRQHRGAL